MHFVCVPGRQDHQARSKFKYVLAPRASPKRTKVACFLCHAKLSRRNRLLQHASTVHGAKGKALRTFLREARALNAPGVERAITRDRLRTVLAGLPPRATPRLVAKEILKVTNVSLIECQDASSSEESDSGSSDAEEPPRKERVPRPVWAQTPDEPDSDGESADGQPSQAAKAPENCRRMPRDVISSLGLARGYGQDHITHVFQTQYAANQLTSPATAKQRAGLLYRFLAYARQFHPDSDALQAITSPHIATSYIDMLRSAGFKPQSLINQLDAIKACIVQIQFSRPVQEAFKFRESHRQDLERAAGHWSALKSYTQKQGAARQRKKLQASALEDWTEFFPVAHALDYLSLVREALVDSGEDIRVPSPGVIPGSGATPGKRGVRLNVSTLRCAAGLLGALSGCRLTALLELTRDELARRESWQGITVLSIKTHKTELYYGPARVALRPHQVIVFDLLAQETKLKYPAQYDRVFGLSPTHGRASEIIFKEFNSYLQARTGGPQQPFTLNNARKAAETFSHLLTGCTSAGTGSKAARDAVTKFLLHGERVARKNYRHASSSEVVSQYRVYSNLLAVLALLELVRANRISLKEVSVAGQQRKSRTLKSVLFLRVSRFPRAVRLFWVRPVPE